MFLVINRWTKETVYQTEDLARAKAEADRRHERLGPNFHYDVVETKPVYTTQTIDEAIAEKPE